MKSMTASSTPDDCETTGVARLRRETHARILHNGLFTRPGRARLPDGIGLRDLGLVPHRRQFLPVLTPTRPHPATAPGPARSPLRPPIEQVEQPTNGADQHARFAPNRSDTTSDAPPALDRIIPITVASSNVDATGDR